MQRFLRNLLISAVVLICGLVLYQQKQQTTAEYFDGVVVTSVSSGYLTYTGTSFEVMYVGLSGLTTCMQLPSNYDVIYAYLSDSINSGTVSGKPVVTGTVCSDMPGWTGTINISTTYQTYTGSTLYLHIFVKDSVGTPKGYGEQEITFVASGSGGGFPGRDVIYTSIGSTISGQGIMNNFNLVNSGNVSNFSGLYFAKMSGSTELGRITFYTGLDLTDTGTQNFLSGELPASIGMEEGQVWFRPGTGFEGKNATLEIRMPEFRAPYLSGMDANDFYVREGSGGALTGNDMISSVTPGGTCGSGQFGCAIDLNVGHFTMFGVKPILTYVHIRSDAGTGAWSGNTIYLAFSGSEALTGVTVQIGAMTGTLQGGGGTDRVFYKLLTTGGMEGIDIDLTINFSDMYGNSGNMVTTTTDGSYVKYYNSGSGGPNRNTIYTSIGNSLTSSGIYNNFSSVNNSNVTGFTNLYFAKMSGANELGRITFATGLDLTDTGTQNFLQYELPNSIGMDQGEIWFNPGTGFVGKNATLTMNLPNARGSFLSSITGSDFIVREGSGGALTGNDMISSVALSGSCGAGDFGCTLNLDVSHFTSFEIAPFKNITQSKGYSDLQSAVNDAATGDIITILPGAPSLYSLTISKPLNLSGTYTVTQEIILNAKPIVLSGITTIQFYVTANGSIKDAAKYVSAGGGLNLTGGATYTESGIVINISNLNFPGGNGTLSNPAVIDCGGAGTAITINGGSNVHVYGIDFQNCTKDVVILGAGSNNYVSYSRIGSMIENLSASSSPSTPNRRGAATKPVAGTDYSGSFTYSPRCIDTTCSATENGTPPTPTITYSPTSGTITTGSVTATVSFNKTGVTITNNGGLFSYTFTGDYSFGFDWQDLAYNTGTALATVTWIDQDGDGFVGANDCDDTDPTEFSGQVWYADCDGDTYERTGAVVACDVAAANAAAICSDMNPPDGGWTHIAGNDCNDESASTYSGATEIAGDGIDQNCDGRDLYNDATLSSLTVSGGTLSGTFSSGINTYTVNFMYSYVGTVSITGTKNNAYASIVSGSYSLSLTIGSIGSMFITVQSESGNTNTYTVNVTRDPASTDATLNTLTPSTGSLSGTFSSGVTGYTLNFPYSYTGSVSITGAKNHTYASIVSGSYSLALTKGSTGSMFITVQSESGNTNTYTVTVTRTPASTDANLTSLNVSTGSLSGTFNSGTTSYTLQMLYSYIGTITSTPVVSNAYATITGTTSINLSTAGSTGTLSSTVTAEDGTTTKTYTIGITRTTPTSVATNTIDGTVTVTGGSADLSGATTTGATFTSTGTLTIVGDTTNDYLQFSASGFIITASGGTWDGILLAPESVISGTTPSANFGETGIPSQTEGSTTRTILITVQAGANNDSLTSTGGNFKVSFVVPGGTNGNVLKIYRSTDGSTWIVNTPDASCTLNASLVCSFYTDHLSYFTTIKETTSGGGGGGGGGGNSYFTGDDTYTGNRLAVRGSGSIIGSPFTVEMNNAYLYAYQIGITTMNTIQEANMTGNLIRAHMAKMMVAYAIKVLGKTIDTTKTCTFNDIAGQTTELKNYIKRSCQLGLMGQGITSFNPEGEVTRAQFGTVLSRALYGTGNDGGDPYYLNHLTALKNAGIISKTIPDMKEIRGYVMLMLYRAQ